MDDEEFVTFMKLSLPEYVVQCFIHSGYDTARVVAQMNTEKGPNNSIDEIEAFILQNFPLNETCYHMSLPSKSYVFTPGHRARICNFIEDVKQRFALDKLPTLQPPSKRMKIGVGDRSQVAAQHDYDLEAIYEDLRGRIINWIRKQPEMFHLLQEHKHYKINIRLQKSGYPEVDILCLLKNCNAPIRLGIKKDDGSNIHILSNWTSHVSKCLKKSKETHGSPLELFFTKKPKSTQAVIEQHTPSTKKDFQKAPLVKVNQEGQC